MRWMNGARSWSIRGGLLASVALVVAPVLASAHGRGGHSQTIADTPGASGDNREDDAPAARIPPEATVYPVQLSSAEDVGDGCRYTASVRGRVALVPHGRAPEGAHYQPDLTVVAELRCPGQPVRATGARRLTRALGSQLALVEALESRAEIVDGRAGHVCMYSPHFRFEAGELRAASVTSECAPIARGGGPR